MGRGEQHLLEKVGSEQKHEGGGVSLRLAVSTQAAQSLSKGPEAAGAWCQDSRGCEGSGELEQRGGGQGDKAGVGGGGRQTAGP